MKTYSNLVIVLYLRVALVMPGSCAVGMKVMPTLVTARVCRLSTITGMDWNTGLSLKLRAFHYIYY